MTCADRFSGLGFTAEQCGIDTGYSVYLVYCIYLVISVYCSLSLSLPCPSWTLGANARARTIGRAKIAPVGRSFSPLPKVLSLALPLSSSSCVSPQPYRDEPAARAFRAVRRASLEGDTNSNRMAAQSCNNWENYELRTSCRIKAKHNSCGYCPPCFLR